MSHVKSNTLKRCFSLLREYVEESKAENHKKGAAILTLNQLQKIMAGTDRDTVILGLCSGRPIADWS